MQYVKQYNFFQRNPVDITLTILFLFAPLYHHANPGGEGLKIPHSGVIWFTALVFIAYTLNKILKNARFLSPKNFSFILAFPVLVTVSGFVVGTEQQLVWLFRMLFIWGGVFFYFCLFQHRFTQGRVDRLLYILVLAGLLHSFIGAMQIWFKLELPFLRSPNGIPSGLFQQVNNEASFLVTAILITFFLLSRPLIIKERISKLLPLILTITLASYVVMASGSRIGLLSLIVGMPILLISRRHQLVRNKKVFLVALFAFLIGLTGAYVSGSSRVIDKTLAMQSGYSKESRLGIYSITFKLIENKPLFGHGIGSFPRVFQGEKPSFYRSHPNAHLTDKMITHPHNEALFWFVEGGLIAFSGILFLAMGTVLALKACGWSRGGAYLALLIPLILHLQVELPFYISSLPWFVFIFLLFLPFRHQLIHRANTLSLFAQKFSLIALWSMFCLLTGFLIHTLLANWDFNQFMKAGRNPETHKMTTALSNPYMSDFAYEVESMTYLNTAIQLQNIDYLQSYVRWSTAKILVQPSPLLFENLTKAYLALGEFSEACVTYENGRAIYPKNTIFKSSPKACM